MLNFRATRLKTFIWFIILIFSVFIIFSKLRLMLKEPTEQAIKEKFGAAKHLDLLAQMRARAKNSIKYNAGKLVDITLYNSYKKTIASFLNLIRSYEPQINREETFKILIQPKSCKNARLALGANSRLNDFLRRSEIRTTWGGTVFIIINFKK